MAFGQSDGLAAKATEQETGRCIIIVTPDGERSMNTYLGACTGAKIDDLRAAASLLRGRRAATGVRLIVAAQATTVSVLGLLIGVPLGLVIGRAVWRVVAGDLGVGECAGEVVSLFGIEVVKAESLNFEATIAAKAPASVDVDVVQSALEQLAAEIQVDVTLVP